MNPKYELVWSCVTKVELERFQLGVPGPVITHQATSAVRFELNPRMLMIFREEEFNEF